MEFRSHSQTIFFNLSYWKAFFEDLVRKRLNLYEHNYKNFDEGKLNEALPNTDWNNILQLEKNDPNFSKNNFHQHLNTLLDEYAPYKKK